MKMQEFYDKLDDKKRYRVHFEWHKGNLLESDHFPDRSEEPFYNEGTAWWFAGQWAHKMGEKVVNVYVVNMDDWCPVEGYREKMLNRYPPYEVLYESSAIKEAVKKERDACAAAAEHIAQGLANYIRARGKE